MWGCQGPFLIIAPTVHAYVSNNPSRNLTISGTPYHLSTPPMSYMRPSLFSHVINFWIPANASCHKYHYGAVAYPGVGRCVIRYHPIYDFQCYFVLFYTLPHLIDRQVLAHCRSCRAPIPYSYQPYHPCQYRTDAGPIG